MDLCNVLTLVSEEETQLSLGTDSLLMRSKEHSYTVTFGIVCVCVVFFILLLELFVYFWNCGLANFSVLFI